MLSAADAVVAIAPSAPRAQALRPHPRGPAHPEPDRAPAATRSDWFIDKGLRELFDEISPIQDFTGKVMELHFKDYEFGEPKYSELECRTRDLTFSRAALRGRRAAHQGDRRDPAPARLHGRLPDHDRPGHVHHQRRRARRRQPAGPLARASTTPRARGPGHRPRPASTPRSSRTAAPGSSSRPPPATSSTSRSTASASSRRPSCCAPSATRSNDEMRALFSPVDTDAELPYIASTLEKDSTTHAAGSPHRGLQEAAPGRSAHR